MCSRGGIVVPHERFMTFPRNRCNKAEGFMERAHPLRLRNSAIPDSSSARGRSPAIRLASL